MSGMAPAAKIAAYKVCFNDSDPNTGGRYTSSTLDAVDDAVTDGADVSLSWTRSAFPCRSCTSQRWCRSATTPKVASTTAASSPRARPQWKPCGA